MFEHEYRSRFDSVAPSPELVADTKTRLRAALAGKERPRRHLTRRGLAVLAAAAVLTATALAAVPAVWQVIQNDLGNRAPYAAQMDSACQDQGIRIQVQAALADTRVTRLYFTVQDLTGNTLDADTTSDLLLSLETNGQFDWGNGGKGLEVLSYDPEQQLATLVYSRGTADLADSPPTRARLEATYFIPGHRQARLALAQDELPAQALESTVTDNGATILLPVQNPMTLDKDGTVSISSMGFAADGRYHVRFIQKEDVFPLIDDGHSCCVEYYLYDPENPDRWPQQGMGDVICTAVKDGWDFCLPSLTPDTLKYLELVHLRTEYAAAGGQIEGNWKITVPVEVMTLRAATPATPLVFPYTHGGEMPFGRARDAQLQQITVSPLSICADFITPEGQEYPCQLTGTELSLTVTLADGTVLTPVYYDEVWNQRAGWVMWEFEDPIDPSEAVSVTFNGQTIPLSRLSKCPGGCPPGHLRDFSKILIVSPLRFMYNGQQQFTVLLRDSKCKERKQVMSYSVQNIRNVCLLGHGGNGKTSLAESMLYLTGGTPRLGNPVDGNTVCDYDPEETRRQISISTAVAPVEYNGCKINVLDTPGYFDFSGEVIEALQVSDAAIIVCSAKGGMSVGAEKAWKLCQQRKLPRLLYISKTDEDNSDYNAAFETLRERFGKNIAPVVAPIWDADKKVIGFIDVLHKRAFEAGPKGERVEIDVPDEKKSVLDELYDALKESVAETSEELMDKYFSGEDFTYAEMIQGLRAGVKDLSLFPVVCGSAVSGLGTRMLLDIIVELLPSPLEGRPLMGENEKGELDEFVPSPGALPCALVWKTVSDQYGKYSYVKVLSGNLKPDMQVVNSRTGATEKLGRLYVMKGKKAEEVKELECGDIGAIGKMEKVKTGDTLSDPRKVVKLEAIPFPEPCYSVAITPKTKGQEDKIAAGLTRLNEEDLTFNWVNNAETHQMVVSGTGDMQMDVILSRLKSRFGVDAELSEPRVAYREKIRKKVEVQGRHKKQTGGHGQFGDVWMRFEPGDTEELQFCEEVVGGAVPKNYFPAVEKGMREAVVHGVLAGYPVVYLKATLFDGSYHPVDSSEMAFKTAVQIAYKTGMPQASPVLLEPIGELKVTIPDSYMGDVIGDLNKRRGRVMGMNPDGEGNQVVEAEVPMAEMGRYAIDLRSMTQGRGSFTFHFVRYEDAPPAAQEKAIEAAKAMQDEAD